MLPTKKTNKLRSDTNKCTHVLKFIASPPDDVSQAEDGTVGGDLLVIAASLQIAFISRLKNVGPSKATWLISKSEAGFSDERWGRRLTLKIEIW